MHLRPAWFHLLAACLAVLPGGPRPFAGVRTAPLLEFDVPFSIACRSLPLKGPARDDPGKQLIEVVIPISAHLRVGSEKDLKRCRYTLVDPGPSERLSVTDWLPRTELRTEFAKPIQFSKEHLGKIGISLSAHYVLAAAGEAGGQLKSAVTYEMLPPQEIVLASGTVQHGHGVFFELKPSTQTTIEGMKTFSAIFRVHRGWRGGCLKLECTAVGLDRGVVQKLDREVSSGLAVFYLALYRAGDGEAEKLADQVAECEQELLGAFVQRQHEKAAGHRLFPWPSWLGKQPWFLDKSDSPDEDSVAPDEVALLNCVLDAGTPTRPVAELPLPIRQKLRALHEAVEALQVLSDVDPPTRDQTGASQGQSPSPSQSAKAALPAATADKRSTSASGGAMPPGAESSSSKPADGQETPKTGAVPSLQPKVGDSAKPLESAGEGDGGRTEPSNPGQLSHDFPKQAWYLLVSIWGALFTYIVAPLVVEFIRTRMKAGRRNRSRCKPRPIPPSVGRWHHVSLPR